MPLSQSTHPASAATGTAPGEATPDQHYRLLFETARDAIVVIDAETGSIVRANAAAANLIGRPVDAIVGMHQRDLYPADDVDRYGTGFRAASREPADQPAMGEVYTSDGRRVPVEISVSAFVAADGRRLVQATFRDLSAARSASERIEQLLSQQTAVNHFARLLGSTLDLTELCRIAHAEIEKIVGHTNFGISTYDAATQEIKALYIVADGEFVDVSQLPVIPLEPGMGPQSRAITTQLPNIIDDMVVERARVRTHVNVQTREPRHARAILTVPMLVGDQVVGTLQMQSYEPAAYSAVDIPLLTGIANQFALAFQNARLYAQVEQELAARKRSEWVRTLLNRILTVFHVEDGSGMYDRVLAILLEATESSCGFFGYINIAGDLICPAATCARHGFKATGDTPIRMPTHEWGDALADALMRRQTLVVDQRLELPAVGMMLDSAVITPLTQGSELIGVLAVANRAGGYGLTEINLLDTICAQVSPVLAARRQRDREQQARQAALAALQESEEQYRKLFAANPEPMWVYDLETYRFLDVNEAAVVRYGYSLCEFLTMRLHDIRPPEELGRLEENLRQARTPHDTSGPWKHRTQHGEIILVDITSHMLQWEGRPAAVVQARDVTARVHAERALLASERKFRDLAEQLPSLILIVDGSGVRYVNRRGAAMLERTVEEVLSPAFAYSLFLAPALGATTTAGEVETYEVEVILPHDRRLTFWSASKPIEYEGEDATLIVATDITAARRLEEQLRQAQKMEAIGVPAGGIAHDFNNLLTPILSYSELMLSRAEAKSREHRFLSNIHAAAERAKGLVRQILAFSRTHRSAEEAVDVCACVDEVLDLLRPTLPSTIEIRKHFGVAEIFVLADSHEIVQVIMNLCTNAYQAIGEASGLISIEVGRVPNRAPAEAAPPREDAPADEWVRLTIQDTGAGMDAATQQHIFEPFFTTKGVGKGTGLGLPVVYGIVHKLHGRIEVQSEPGRGTTFVVDLPEMNTAPVVAEAPPDCAARGSGERILLVDDDAGTLNAMRQVLLEHGYAVSAFQDSTSALDVYLRAPGAFDLVLSDQVMPAMTGDELVAAIRQRGHAVPAIILTGYSERLTPALAAERGVHAVLPKPVEHATLLCTLRAALAGDV